MARALAEAVPKNREAVEKTVGPELADMLDDRMAFNAISDAHD